MKRLVLCLLLAMGLTGCAGAAYKLPDVSNADLAQMQQKMAEHKEPLKVYGRSEKNEKQLVQRIADRLAGKAGPLCTYAEYPACSFQVVYDPSDTVNAYASEGYKVTVFHGLLQYLKSEDEVAAVIAHEMGHHLAHHNQEMVMNTTTGAAVAGVLTAVVLAAANANNPYYDAYQQQQNDRTVGDMMKVGAQIGAISYSKEQEREADLLGAYLLSRAGYDLDRAENIFFVMANLPGEKHNDGRASLTDTHPNNPERIVAWEKAIVEIKNNPSKLPYAKPAEKTKDTVK